MVFDDFIDRNVYFIMGRPKSGKTTILKSFPKPLLYISVGNDGGGKVLKDAQFENGKQVIFVKNLKTTYEGNIAKSSIEHLADILAEIRRGKSPIKFKTVAIDTLGALQADYVKMLEIQKKKSLNENEWGDVQRMMLSVKDNMLLFAEQENCNLVWCTHTRELELYETSELSKQIRIVPDLTVSTSTKYMKDADYILYNCRLNVKEGNSQKVKFVTYIGPHPLMDTGVRGVMLETGFFMENFTHSKFQQFLSDGTINKAETIDVKNNDVQEIKEEENK